MELRDEDSYIGSIDLFTIDLLNESTTKTNFPKLGKCDIIVRGNEGPIPHFHIASKDDSFHCCVCITQPRYFKHGNKNGELNRKQRIALNNFLHKKDEYSVLNISIWDNIVNDWNRNNPSHRIAKSLQKEQPDYTTMTDSIHL